MREVSLKETILKLSCFCENKCTTLAVRDSSNLELNDAIGAERSILGSALVTSSIKARDEEVEARYAAGAWSKLHLRPIPPREAGRLACNH